MLRKIGNLLLVFCLVSFLSGCINQNHDNQNVNSIVNTNTEKSIEISLTQGGEEIHGIAVERDDAIAEIDAQEMDYQMVTAEPALIVESNYPVQNIEASMMDEEGVLFLCAVNIIEISDNEYQIQLCDQEGLKLVLCIIGEIEGEEVNYCYPLEMENVNLTEDYSNDYFSLSISDELFINAGENEEEDDIEIRIQNYDSNEASENYELAENEYIVEIFASSEITEEDFRNSYETVSEDILNGKDTLFGLDRLGGGETITGGNGYFVEVGDRAGVRVNVYATGEVGENSAQEIVDNISWEF